jgi:hypothetical protein
MRRIELEMLIVIRDGARFQKAIEGSIYRSGENMTG